MMRRFAGKVVLVTGGTSGIGLATVKRLSQEGASVIATGTNSDRLVALRSELPDGVVFANDAGDSGAAEILAETIRREVGQIDGAFLNAGFGRFQPLSDVSAAEFDAQYAVNVRGALLHAKAIAPLLKDGGAILFNTSIARDMGMAGAAIYASTKGAVRTITKVLAREFAPRQIRVNAVSPGPIGTGFLERTGMSTAEIESFGAAVLSQVPMGRFGKPSEVAAVATFLLSEDASFVTGAEYSVDGGMGEL